MNSASGKKPPRPHPRRRRFGAFLLLAVRHSSSWLLRLAFLLLLLLLILFAYLHLVGMPAYLTDLFLDRMAARGYFLQIERLTLEIDRGLVAKDVRLFAAAQAPEPFLEARELTVALNPLPLLFGRNGTRPVLSIVDGTLRAHLGQARYGARQGSRTLTLDRINLRLAATKEEALLREFSADFLNIRFRGRGAIFLSPEARRPRLQNPLVVALDTIENLPDWMLQLVEQINQIAFTEPPAAEFAFAIHAEEPEANEIAIRLDIPAGGRVRGVDFDQGRLDVSWKDRQLRLPDFQLHRNAGVLSLSGWFNSTNQMVSAHLLNTLPPDTFLDLLPENLRQQAAGILADDRFPLRLELHVGPAPLARAAEKLSGRLTFSRATVRSVPVESLDAAFARDADEISFGPVTLQLDTGPNASRLQIQDGFFRLASRRFQARVTGTINPHLLKPLLTPNQRTIVEWFGIQEPLQGDVVVGGTAGDPAIYCFGPVQATNFTLQGVAVQSLRGRLDITNEVMHITGGILSRPEGNARGDLHMAFSNQTLRLDAESTLDARDTARMIGPAAAKFMEPFRLNGPVRLRIAGLLDYCNFSLNNLQAHIEAQRFGYARWEADAAEFDLAVLGRRLRFLNATATAYGGKFAGSGLLYPVGGDANWRYDVDFTATNASLTDLLSATLQKPVKELRGALDAAGRIGGYVGKGTGPGATGTGRITVRGGMLFQTKLFSGLSAILEKIIPDFTLFAQTDATGDYTLRNGRACSRNIELQGTVFSVKADGSYGYNGSLDYDVEVQLLRGGPVAALVRLATLPVTRLLKFNLSGTFEEPRWRPVNLNPAELFGGEGKPAAAAPP